MADACAEKNAPFKDDYKKNLGDIERHATKLEELLFRGTTHVDAQAAGAALARVGEFDPRTDDDLGGVLNPLHVEPGILAFEATLRRVASNCRAEIRRADLPGVIEHEAWDLWIRALLNILRTGGLPHGVATPAYEDNHSRAVRFVSALQRLLPASLRRHDRSLLALAKAMMAARATTRKTRTPKR
jgi:hypothetical protein